MNTLVNVVALCGWVLMIYVMVHQHIRDRRFVREFQEAIHADRSEDRTPETEVHPAAPEEHD